MSEAKNLAPTFGRRGRRGGEVQLAIYNSLANKLLKLIGDHNPFDRKMWSCYGGSTNKTHPTHHLNPLFSYILDVGATD